MAGHPHTSAHLSGDVVDIGPSDATAWLSEHGAMYGLWQIYSNEHWHSELRPEAVDHGRAANPLIVICQCSVARRVVARWRGARQRPGG